MAPAGRRWMVSFPVSSFQGVRFGKVHSGTGFGKAEPTGDRQRNRRGGIPVNPSQSGRLILCQLAGFIAARRGRGYSLCRDAER